ncbi:microsomal glutathione S-transferase 2-like [Lineus longissimus]|uniref:microsomal glutathione S-transferase 2-like n=1 Tax=Lineus longissimus TaxID=88925 RepID=UPI002B4C58AF
MPVLVDIDDFVLVAAVTLGASYQMVMFTRRVGQARSKFRVEPPDTVGPPEFTRTYRAHMNCVEFFPLFLTLMWTSAAYAHQIPAAALGLMYIYGRFDFFNGYVKAPEKRLSGFFRSVKSLKYLTYLSAGGLINAAIRSYIGIDIPRYLLSFIW